MQYEKVYWDATLMKTDGNYPSILAIGDSWFWYPFPGGSLLNYLGGMVATREQVVLTYGNNGATGPTRIILHNYDYARVTGQGIFGRGSSPWLRPAFEAAKVSAGLRDECIEILINRFTTTLEEVVARYPGRVALVDSRGALQRTDWANELHPTPQGFRKIAARWLPVLRNQGLAK